MKNNMQIFDCEVYMFPCKNKRQMTRWQELKTDIFSLENTHKYDR